MLLSSFSQSFVVFTSRVDTSGPRAISAVGRNRFQKTLEVLETFRPCRVLLANERLGECNFSRGESCWPIWERWEPFLLAARSCGETSSGGFRWEDETFRDTGFKGAARPAEAGSLKRDQPAVSTSYRCARAAVPCTHTMGSSFFSSFPRSGRFSINATRTAPKSLNFPAQLLRISRSVDRHNRQGSNDR